MSTPAKNDDQPEVPPYHWDPPPPDFYDPVIEVYKKDVDRTLLRENLKLTVDERFRKFASFARFAEELRQAGERHRANPQPRPDEQCEPNSE